MHRLCLGAHRPKALHPSARGMIQPPPDQACVSSSPTIVSPASANIELLTEQLGLVDRVWRPEHAGTPAAMGVLDRSFPSRSPAFPTKLHMPACLPAATQHHRATTGALTTLQTHIVTPVSPCVTLALPAICQIPRAVEVSRHGIKYRHAQPSTTASTRHVPQCSVEPRQRVPILASAIVSLSSTSIVRQAPHITLHLLPQGTA